MPLTLYDATIPSFLQLLAAADGWLTKAEASSLSETEIADAQLTDDMLPFAFQVKSMAVHSQGAIQGVQAGAFSPDMGESPATFAGMRARIVEAEAFLKELRREEVEGLIGRDMEFRYEDFTIPFTAENFLLSFSLPNFYFHATTAYDILRMKGVALGKLDFMGSLRTKSG